MADKRQFFRDINPGDVSVEGRQSNGITARADGSVILYSGVKENELDNLQKYNGTIPTDGYLGNIIAVLKSDQEVSYPIGNNNEETYIESAQIDPNKIVTQQTNNIDCNNEFTESSEILLNWENDNRNLGWDPYGANGTNIKDGELDKAKKYFLDNYWNTNNQNTGNFSIASDAITNKNDPKLLIKNLPPGLRIMAAQFNYNAKQWWTRILATAGEDWLNSGFGVSYKSTANLGPNGADSYEYLLKDGTTKSGKYVYNPYRVSPDPNKEFTLRGDKRIQLFIDQYDQIISLYNQDKGKFLLSLKDETIRYYTAFDGSNTTKLNFHKKYVEKAYDLAIKYKDCDPNTVLKYPSEIQTQQSQSQSQSQTSNNLPSKETTPPEPALEYLPEDEKQIQPFVQIYEDIDYYRDVEIINGLLNIATAGYSVRVQALYDAEKGGVNSKTKTSKEILDAAKSMIDKAIARYPIIADKTKYPDAINRLLALCLVAYNECRFTPHNENPNHSYNTAQRAKLKKVRNLTKDEFYKKFGVKSGDENKVASGEAHTLNPENIFNYAYGDANGNGNEASGDGYKFRGRGYYGITYKSSYKKVGKEVYGDENKFLTNPDSINGEPTATDVFLKAMFEGGLCALSIGLLAYTNTPAIVNGYKIGTIVEVTLLNGTKKKIRGDKASNYSTGKGANNLVNGNTSPGYEKNYSNIYSSQELKDYINSKLK